MKSWQPHHEKHYQEEEDRARTQLKLELAPWYSLRQRAIADFHLDQKPDDGTTRIILGVIDLLNVIEQDGPSTAMLLDGMPMDSCFFKSS